MSKRLLLVRHAKAEWQHQKGDFARELAQEGIDDSNFMPLRLINNQLFPQHIISSPAKRAVTTATNFARHLNFPEEKIQQELSIYEATDNVLLKIINEKIDNNYEFIALFGHNPGIPDLATRLCDSALFDFPTCAVLLIEFPYDDWKQISFGSGTLKFFDYPKGED